MKCSKVSFNFVDLIVDQVFFTLYSGYVDQKKDSEVPNDRQNLSFDDR
jgi:hypothetical protein